MAKAVGSTDFVGRIEDLSRLEQHLSMVREGRGRLVSVRGRRQIGKSRLVSEFVAASGLPQLFVTGSLQGSLAEDLEAFRQDALLDCTLPGAELLASSSYTTWEQALRTIHAALPTDSPSIVVIDEFPWLLQRSAGLDGTMQKLWDRIFEKTPVLFILIGSDLSVMEMLGHHDRPLFGRMHEMVIEPLTIRDMTRLAGADSEDNTAAGTAFDAMLLTGGYPRLVQQWSRTPSVGQFLKAQLADEATELVATGRRVLAAEFPQTLQAATVLRAIGSGERGFTAIASTAGVGSMTLTRSLELLQEKHVIAADYPTSIKSAPKLARYRVDDPYLRFWLRFVEPVTADIQRGRPDLAVARVNRDWNIYRGKAVEPLVRQALTRLAADDPDVGGAEFVGGWWPRSNNPEIDLVGVSPARDPRRVHFLGSIKCRSNAAFDERDLNSLAQARAIVPGASRAKLLAVTWTKCTAAADIVYRPKDLIQAWK